MVANRLRGSTEIEETPEEHEDLVVVRDESDSNSEGSVEIDDGARENDGYQVPEFCNSLRCVCLITSCNLSVIGFFLQSDSSSTSIAQVARFLENPPPHPYRLIGLFELLEDS